MTDKEFARQYRESRINLAKLVGGDHARRHARKYNRKRFAAGDHVRPMGVPADEIDEPTPRAKGSEWEWVRDERGFLKCRKKTDSTD